MFLLGMGIVWLGIPPGFFFYIPVVCLLIAVLLAYRTMQRGKRTPRDGAGGHRFDEPVKPGASTKALLLGLVALLMGLIAGVALVLVGVALGPA